MTEKPGERALEAMKKMENAIVEFKMPKVPMTKKGKMKILTEEQYVEVKYYDLTFYFESLCFVYLCKYPLILN